MVQFLVVLSVRNNFSKSSTVYGAFLPLEFYLNVCYASSNLHSYFGFHFTIKLFDYTPIFIIYFLFTQLGIIHMVGIFVVFLTVTSGCGERQQISATVHAENIHRERVGKHTDWYADSTIERYR